MIIDAVSDLHGNFPELEGGDLLIIAGDLTKSDKPEQYQQFFDWLSLQSYKMKVFTLGNHDNQAMSQFDWHDAELLLDCGLEFEGLKIWGSPWTPWFAGVNPKCTAFMLKTEEELAEKWAMIPDDVDILVTHSPPWGCLDAVKDTKERHVQRAGSTALKQRVLSVKPRLHVFGHIHECYGVSWKRKSVNASHVNERYEPVNRPIRVIL